MLELLSKSVKHITIEPVYFFHYTTYILLDLINTNLYLQKACRFNATTEPDLSTPCDNEKQGVLFASKINSNYRYVMFTVCILYTMLATCWSDESGRRRRPLIFLPIFGQILQSINGCVHSYFWYWTPLSAAISDMIFEMSVGGISLMIIAVQIYVCDMSNTENRTMRLGLLWGVKTLCMPVGNGSAGFLLRTIGFFYSYFVCLVLSAISLLLVVILVKDISVVPAEKPSFLQLFNPIRIVHSFKVVFKKTLGSKRSLVLLLLIAYVAVYFTFQGEKTVFYLFIRYKFHWDEKQFSLYLVYRNIVVVSGTLFCSFILSKWLKIHDGLIGAFAGMWDIVAVIAYLLADRDWQLYVAALFDLFHGTALSVSVSFLSKFYQGDEFGRLNAALSLFALAIPFSHPAYNIVFQKTIDYFPSAFFFISLFINVMVFVLYCVSYIICRIMKITT
ncbi:probable peptidoglycan muropeptide transporter SLC46 [Planococcus citri]|uniref:probable peptidoglycan muropeptide transporter SLC46 n=1 Tax=Planococcus citri TaxID=170843 RepID=UPI0031F864CA